MTNIKRYGLLLLALLCLLSFLSGCTKQEEIEVVYHTITFDSNGGTPIEEQIVADGNNLSYVTPPTREGYLFDGWKTQDGMLWNFESDFPSSDLTLIAIWIPATDVFAYEPLDDSAAAITKIKELRPELPVPQILGGYTVTAIADGVFAELSAHQVQTISLPSTITSIGEEAFYNAGGIKISIDPTAVLTEIGAGAFFGCDGLGALRLGEGITAIAPDTFFGCTSLKEIRIPKSVIRLEDNAFADCSSLVTVMLHPELTEVGDSAFKGCDSLRTVYYYGTAEQITALRENGTANQNDPFLFSTVYYYSETQPAENGNYWFLTENDRPKLW